MSISCLPNKHILYTSFDRVHRRDGQRRVVLPRLVGAGAEEAVDALSEGVREGVDVDLSIDVVEGNLHTTDKAQT